jgi:hypothetical protein
VSRIVERYGKPAVLLMAGVVLLMGTVAARSASGAQSAPRPAAGARSTLSGVYTTAQATRGEVTYSNICVSCHPFITYTGATFRQHWLGKTVFDLYAQVSELMPKNEPGSLSPREYADVIAFILQLNKMPPGKTELPTDAASLRRIRIELKGGLD